MAKAKKKSAGQATLNEGRDLQHDLENLTTTINASEKKLTALEDEIHNVEKNIQTAENTLKLNKSTKEGPKVLHNIMKASAHSKPKAATNPPKKKDKKKIKKGKG